MVGADRDDGCESVRLALTRLFALEPHRLALRHGVNGGSNEWGKLLNLVGRLVINDSDRAQFGFPYEPDNLTKTEEVAARMSVGICPLEFERGSDRDWVVGFGRPRFAGVLYYQHRLWPSLVLPSTLEWALESPESPNTSYLYSLRPFNRDQ